MPESLPVSLEANAVRAAAEKRLMRWYLPHITPDPNQPRREFDERGLRELAENMRANGQLCPVIGYPETPDSKRLILVDGERRLRAAWRIPLEFLDALVLPAAPSAGELLLSQLSLGQFREKLSARDLEAAYSRLLAEFGLTQRGLAERLGVSETKVSNVLAYRRVAPELQSLAAALESTVVPVIARLPKDEQPVVMAYASTAIEGGRFPTRDQVEAFIKARSKPVAKGPRPKPLRGRIAGRTVAVELLADDDHDKLVEWAKALIAFVQKNKTIAVENLALVTGG